MASPAHPACVPRFFAAVALIVRIPRTLTATSTAAGPRYRLAWIFILFAGLILRFALTGNHSFWHDEGATLYLATAPEPVEALRGSRHPPVSIYAFRAWIQMFSESDAVVRLLPALVSSVALLVFMKMVEMAGRGVPALCAAAIYACAPFQNWYACEVTPYAFLELGSMLTTAATFGVLTRAKNGAAVPIYYYFMLAAGSAFAFGSQYMGFLAGFSAAAVAVVAWLRAELRFSQMRGLVAAAVLGGAIWIPWLVSVFPDQQKTVWGNEAKLGARALFELPARLLLIDPGVGGPSLAIIGITAGALIWAGFLLFIYFTIRRREIHHVCLLVAVVAPFVGALLLVIIMPPNFLPRYLTPAAPALALGVAWGLCEIRRARAGAALCAVLVLCLLSISVLHKTGNRREDYRSACAEIIERWRPGDRVVVITGTPQPFADAPVNHYLRSCPEIVQSITSPAALLPFPADAANRAGARFHVVYRKATYARATKNAFDETCATVEESPDRFGVRRILYAMK